jgi:hypothetical protein
VQNSQNIKKKKKVLDRKRYTAWRRLNSEQSGTLPLPFPRSPHPSPSSGRSIAEDESNGVVQYISQGFVRESLG